MAKIIFRTFQEKKNLKVGVFGTDFKQVPFVFRLTTCTYCESWGPVENVCDPLHPHPPRGAAVGKKMAEKPKKGPKSQKNLKVGVF